MSVFNYSFNLTKPLKLHYYAISNSKEIANDHWTERGMNSPCPALCIRGKTIPLQA